MAPFPPKRKQALMNERSWEEKEVINCLTLTAREPMHLFWGATVRSISGMQETKQERMGCRNRLSPRQYNKETTHHEFSVGLY